MEYAIADLHVTQETMCTYSAPDGSKLRPWDTADEMDEALIARWNAVVSPEDKVYVLGDATGSKGIRKALRKYDLMNGVKVLLMGNHDDEDSGIYLRHFRKLYGCRVLPARRAILSHVPWHPGSLKPGWVNIHGHLHASEVTMVQGADLVADPRYYSVSVERIGFQPIPLDEAIDRAHAALAASLA